MSDPLNPYNAPLLSPERTQLKTRWRIIPAAASIIVGVTYLALGLGAVGILMHHATTRNIIPAPAKSIATCISYLVFGAVWTLAGRQYWLGQFRLAVATSIAGTLILVALYARGV